MLAKGGINVSKTTESGKRVDELGRIVIPKDIRKILGLEKDTPVEIYRDGDKVIIKRFEQNQTCIICGETEDVVLFKGKCLCRKCVDEIKSK